MKTVDFLDAVRRTYGLTTDYQLAKKLGFSTSRVAQYRISSRELDDEGCLKVAELLEMPAPYVMACIAAARAKSTEARRAWEKAAKMLKAGTAAALLGAALFVGGEVKAAANDGAADSLYILSNRRKGVHRAPTRRVTRPRRPRRNRQHRLPITA